MGLRSKDLLGIKDMTADEIKLILDTAATFKDVSERDIKKVPTPNPALKAWPVCAQRLTKLAA